MYPLISVLTERELARLKKRKSQIKARIEKQIETQQEIRKTNSKTFVEEVESEQYDFFVPDFWDELTDEERKAEEIAMGWKKEIAKTRKLAAMVTKEVPPYHDGPPIWP